MKTSIYFVRHGKVNNPENVWYGRLPNFPLDSLGTSQIEQTAKFLTTQGIDLLYSSPLLRARQTAMIVEQNLNLPVHFSNLLLEVKSSIQGKPFSYVETIDHNVFSEKNNQIIGESITDLSNRMQRFISRMIKLYKGQRIVAISHGDPVMIVKAKVDGLPIANSSIRPGKERYIQHGEVYLLEYNGGEKIKMSSVFSPTL